MEGVKGELRGIPYSHPAESCGCSSPPERAAEPDPQSHEHASLGVCVCISSGAVIPGHPRGVTGFIREGSRAIPWKR